ncbi:MAG: AI-2E family transporter [Chloroflexi bacterium]|nr:AI-2E family transporter [Chloroflexota bacterium]
MGNSPLVLPRWLLYLIAVAITVWLAGQLWVLVQLFADILLLFFLSWLLAFILRPLVDYLSTTGVPVLITSRLHHLGAASLGTGLERYRLPRFLAVLFIYLSILLLMILILLVFLPLVANQATTFATRLPDAFAQASHEAPRWWQFFAEQLVRIGLPLEMPTSLPTQQVVGYLQSFAALLGQNALSVATGLASFLANFFLVFILSIYFTLDGPRIVQRLQFYIPMGLREEVEFLNISIDRTFGGFIRGQLVMGLVTGLATAFTMTFLGIGYVALSSALAILFVLIPAIGGGLAILPPLVAALLQGPDKAIWVTAILFIEQQILFNVVMPRILSNAMGLHPLLVFFALLSGIKIAGFWGALFGVPFVAVIWAMVLYLLQRYRPSVTTP